MRPPRPHVSSTTTYGNASLGSFWVEYPSGLVDVTRSTPNPPTDGSEPSKPEERFVDIDVDGERKIRIDPKQSAIVVVDMQKYVSELSYRPFGDNVALLASSCIPTFDLILQV